MSRPSHQDLINAAIAAGMASVTKRGEDPAPGPPAPAPAPESSTEQEIRRAMEAKRQFEAAAKAAGEHFDLETLVGWATAATTPPVVVEKATKEPR